MRIGLLAAAFAAACLAAPADAQAREYRWCAEMMVDDFPVTSCGFDTFAQCMASVSGAGGFCKENPRYLSQSRAPARSKQRRP